MPHLAIPNMGALLLVWEAIAPCVLGRYIDIGGFAIGLQSRGGQCVKKIRI
jgi:hypothetical protein